MRHWKTIICTLLLFTSLTVFVSCKGNGRPVPDSSLSNEQATLISLLKNAHIPELNYQIITTFPHDQTSFTEGFLLDDELMYESTGLYGRSKLRKIELSSGKILSEYSLSRSYFGEGIAIIGDLLYQLTYQEKTAFVYDKNTFALKNKFSYSTQGWGLTSDDYQLIMSNGSSSLSFIDPKTFSTTRSLAVTAQDTRINRLNELEYINGKIYANVWLTSIILVISPETGHVESWFNIQSLRPQNGCSNVETDCLANGIAYNKKDHALLVTGKNWPAIYQLRIEGSE